MQKKCYEALKRLFVTVLNENYGNSKSRHVDADLGGYIIIINSEEEVKSIQSEILNDVI